MNIQISREKISIIIRAKIYHFCNTIFIVPLTPIEF